MHISVILDGLATRSIGPGAFAAKDFFKVIGVVSHQNVGLAQNAFDQHYFAHILPQRGKDIQQIDMLRVPALHHLLQHSES